MPEIKPEMFTNSSSIMHCLGNDTYGDQFGYPTVHKSGWHIERRFGIWVWWCYVNGERRQGWKFSRLAAAVTAAYTRDELRSKIVVAAGEAPWQKQRA